VVNSTNGAPHQPDEDLVRSYLAGKLSTAEAESFEEHFFACDPCWQEVEAANELREALQRAGSPRQVIYPHRWWIGGLAAAAMAAFVFIGVREYTEQRQPVFRGGEQALQTSVKTTGSGLLIEWPADPQAQSYAVVFLSADGATVTRLQIREPRIDVPPETASRARYYRVQALDAFERVLADSGLRRIR
jgi:putative zinc finger protein